METKTRHPLFAKYTVEKLRDLTGYSLRYLVDIKEGRQPATPTFRRYVVAVLGLRESRLFSEEKKA